MLFLCIVQFLLVIERLELLCKNLLGYSVIPVGINEVFRVFSIEILNLNLFNFSDLHLWGANDGRRNRSSKIIFNSFTTNHLRSWKLLRIFPKLFLFHALKNFFRNHLKICNNNLRTSVRCFPHYGRRLDLSAGLFFALFKPQSWGVNFR